MTVWVVIALESSYPRACYGPFHDQAMAEAVAIGIGVRSNGKESAIALPMRQP